MGRLRKNLEHKQIAGLVHYKVQCQRCLSWCWTRPGQGFDPAAYCCVSCAPLPFGRDEERGEPGERKGRRDD